MITFPLIVISVASSFCQPEPVDSHVRPVSLVFFAHFSPMLSTPYTKVFSLTSSQLTGAFALSNSVCMIMMPIFLKQSTNIQLLNHYSCLIVRSSRTCIYYLTMNVQALVNEITKLLPIWSISTVIYFGHGIYIYIIILTLI